MKRMRAAPWLLGLIPLVAIVVLFFSFLLTWGEPPRFVALGFAFFLAAFLAARIARTPGAEVRNGLTSAVPGVVVGGGLGIFAAMQGGDLLLLVAMALGALALAACGGLLAQKLAPRAS